MTSARRWRPLQAVLFVSLSTAAGAEELTWPKAVASFACGQVKRLTPPDGSTLTADDCALAARATADALGKDRPDVAWSIWYSVQVRGRVAPPLAPPALRSAAEAFAKEVRALRNQDELAPDELRRYPNLWASPELQAWFPAIGAALERWHTRQVEGARAATTVKGLLGVTATLATGAGRVRDPARADEYLELGRALAGLARSATPEAVEVLAPRVRHRSPAIGTVASQALQLTVRSLVAAAEDGLSKGDLPAVAGVLPTLEAAARINEASRAERARLVASAATLRAEALSRMRKAEQPDLLAADAQRVLGIEDAFGGPVPASAAERELLLQAIGHGRAPPSPEQRDRLVQLSTRRGEVFRCALEALSRWQPLPAAPPPPKPVLHPAVRLLRAGHPALALSTLRAEPDAAVREKLERDHGPQWRGAEAATTSIGIVCDLGADPASLRRQLTAQVDGRLHWCPAEAVEGQVPPRFRLVLTEVELSTPAPVAFGVVEGALPPRGVRFRVSPQYAACQDAVARAARVAAPDPAALEVDARQCASLPTHTSELITQPRPTPGWQFDDRARGHLRLSDAVTGVDVFERQLDLAHRDQAQEGDRRTAPPEDVRRAALAERLASEVMATTKEALMAYLTRGCEATNAAPDLGALERVARGAFVLEALGASGADAEACMQTSGRAAAALLEGRP